MMDDKLPEALAWAGEHASDAALCAIADAQTRIVPDAVLAHCEACAQCSDAIAAAALLSVDVGHALAAMPRASSAPARAPLPWRALLAALGVAFAGALPALVDAPRAMPGATASLVHTAPVVARSVAHLFRADAWPAWAPLAPAALLVVLGFALLRALPALSSQVRS